MWALKQYNYDSDGDLLNVLAFLLYILNSFYIESKTGHKATLSEISVQQHAHCKWGIQLW